MPAYNIAIRRFRATELSAGMAAKRLQVVQCTHINKATETQTVATAVPALRRSCPGEGGSKAMHRRRKTGRLPEVEDGRDGPNAGT